MRMIRQGPGKSYAHNNRVAPPGRPHEACLMLVIGPPVLDGPRTYSQSITWPDPPLGKPGRSAWSLLWMEKLRL